ncbi:hypothetical protein BGZ73_006460 [Actinomortierella ambigua]|nr:hypothetical protein BGZ73_006460 [Actinomortierella ambigua]
MSQLQPPYNNRSSVQPLSDTSFLRLEKKAGRSSLDTLNFTPEDFRIASHASSWHTKAIAFSKRGRTSVKALKPTVDPRRHRTHHHARRLTFDTRKNPLELPEIVVMILCRLCPAALLHARLVSRTWNQIAQELLFHKRVYYSSATTPTSAVSESSSLRVRPCQFLGARNTAQIHFSEGTSGYSHNDPRFTEEISMKRAIQRQHLQEIILSQEEWSMHAKLTGLEMYGSFDPMDLLLRGKTHPVGLGITHCAEEASSAAMTTFGGGTRVSLLAVTVLDLTVQTPSFALSELDLVALLADFPCLRYLAISLDSYVRVPAGALRNSNALSRLSSKSAAHAHRFEMTECLTPPWTMTELVQQIQQYCPQLQRFHLQPSHGQFSLQDQLELVKGLPNLSELALDMPPPERTPRSLHPLAALNVDRLTTLHLGAFEYDERSMWHLHQFLCRSSRLRELYAKHLAFPIELLIEPSAAKALGDKLIIRSEARQINDVFAYLVQHLPNLTHLDASFHAVSLAKDGGVDHLKRLSKLESAHLVSRVNTPLARHQLDWLLCKRSAPAPAPKKKKNPRQSKQARHAQKRKTSLPTAMASSSNPRGRTLLSSSLVTSCSSVISDATVSASSSPCSSPILPMVASFSSPSPTMSPWASPVQPEVIAMPKSRSPSPFMHQRLSMTVSPVLLPVPLAGLSRVSTRLSDSDSDFEDLVTPAKHHGVSECDGARKGWLEHVSSRVKRLLHLSHKSLGDDFDNSRSPNNEDEVEEVEKDDDFYTGDDDEKTDTVDTGAVATDMNLEQSMNNWMLPRLNQFQITVCQQFPSRPPFLDEIQDRLRKKRPALHAQIQTRSFHVQRRVRSEENARFRL